MASPATPAPGTCARTPRSTSTTSRTGRKPVAGLVLMLVLVLPVVLSVTPWVNLARLGRNQDQVDHGYRALRGLDIAVADSTEARAGQRGLLVTGQDDGPAPSTAGREAASGDIDTVATSTADDAVPRARPWRLRPLAPEVVAEVQATARAATGDVVARGNAGGGAAEVTGDVTGDVGHDARHTATAVAPGGRAAELRTAAAGRTLAVIPRRATGYAAARSRAHGPTTALWHAVEVRRPDGAVDGPCALAVCGSLVRVSTEERWPVAARGVCPACATLAH